MATFISTFIKSALFLSILSFMFWYFFPQMFDTFVSHMSDYFLPFSMFGRVSTLHAMRSFFSTLISPTIIASTVSFIVGNIFPKVLESFLSRMADFISRKIFDVSWIAEKANYFRSLEHTLRALNESLNGLLALKENVISKVNAAELNPNVRQKKEVTLWLDKVKDVEIEVLELKGVMLGEIETLHLRGFFSKINFKSRYEFGKKVDNLKQEMTKLKDEGGNIKDEVAERAPAASAIRFATERIMATKGQQSTFDEVWGCLRGEPAVGIIGLYGPGGVGKTTLLKQINKKFCDESNGFQVVIRVVVSNNPSVEKLQEKIGRGVGFADDESWKNKSAEEKKKAISNNLANKRFVLLLDDIWKWIDFTELGVPLQSLQITGSKIVFTTRQHDVCDSMKSKKFQVKCLADDEAWKLFQETVGNDTLSDPSIVEEAKIMYRECKGLPLALIIIGRAMCSKKRTQEWRAAIRKIRTSNSKISGMEEVYSRLKFSYDSLSQDTTRACLLYCSLFPEDYKIPRRHLIDCWVGEGFLEEYDDGYSIVGELVRACLLEEEEDIKDEYVKMHDVIRDMALWIAKKEKKNFWVEAGVGLTRYPEDEKWKGIKRLSLMDDKIESLQAVPPMCPDLETLFLNNDVLREIPDDFLQSMPSLKVLDLSRNHIYGREFPLGILNWALLQHLDISYTSIQELPKVLEASVNLKCLRAEFASDLCTIPKQLLPKLRKLKVLRLLAYDCDNRAEEDSVLYGGSELLVQELVDLEELNALSLSLKSFHALEIFLKFHKLKGCTQSLDLFYFEGSVTLDILFLKDMKNLDTLSIWQCDSLKSLEMDFSIETHGFHSIQKFVIASCHDLRDLTWLILAPNLKNIEISNCENMEEIIKDEKLSEVQKMTGSLNPFEKLKFLQLKNVHHMKSIYPNALPLPHLKVLSVFHCPNIKKLPLDSKITKNRQISIYGSEDWWKKLQWEDEATKNAFLPCYKGHLI